MTKLRIGVVGIPGSWSTETLADAVEKQTGFRLVVDLQKVVADFSKGRVLYHGQELHKLDGLLVKKVSGSYSPAMLDRIDILRYLGGLGVRVFSRAESILRMVNRLSCTATLRQHQIPMPPTYATESLDEAYDIVNELGAAVLKPLYSTKARGMVVLRANEPDLREQLRDYKDGNQLFYLQKFAKLPDRDYGMVFLGGDYVASYARVRAHGAWNTTTREGGHYDKHEPSAELIELARKAQAPFELDFTSVDVAETASGPIVFEVSAFGGFRGLQEGCGVDAASLYAEYAVKELSR